MCGISGFVEDAFEDIEDAAKGLGKSIENVATGKAGSEDWLTVGTAGFGAAAGGAGMVQGGTQGGALAGAEAGATAAAMLEQEDPLTAPSYTQEDLTKGALEDIGTKAVQKISFSDLFKLKDEEELATISG